MSKYLLVIVERDVKDMTKNIHNKDCLNNSFNQLNDFEKYEEKEV